MQFEYDSLRKELLEWQNRRFTLLTTSTTVVTGVLALGPGVAAKVPAWAVALVLSLFLSAACRLTCYASEANQRIGSFLEVFHEHSGGLCWETRLAAFSGLSAEASPAPFSLNSLLFWLYLLLGIVSASLPYMLFNGVLVDGIGGWIHRWHGLPLVGPSMLFLAVSLWSLRWRRPGRAELVLRCRAVAEREAVTSRSGPSDSSEHAVPDEVLRS
jgi:hypothetical protein